MLILLPSLALAKTFTIACLETGNHATYETSSEKNAVASGGTELRPQVSIRGSHTFAVDRVTPRGIDLTLTHGDTTTVLPDDQVVMTRVMEKLQELTLPPQAVHIDRAAQTVAYADPTPIADLMGRMLDILMPELAEAFPDLPDGALASVRSAIASPAILQSALQEKSWPLARFTCTRVKSKLIRRDTPFPDPNDGQPVPRTSTMSAQRVGDTIEIHMQEELGPDAMRQITLSTLAKMGMSLPLDPSMLPEMDTQIDYVLVYNRGDPWPSWTTHKVSHANGAVIRDELLSAHRVP